MKKVLIFMWIIFPLVGLSQWNIHHNISIVPIHWTCTIGFANAVMVSADTGYYAYSESCSPSSTSSILMRTTDDCASWQEAGGVNGMGCSAKAVKFFPPYVYFVQYQQGIFRIEYGLQGFNFHNLLYWGGYWYQDMYANSPDDYKLILSDGAFAHYLNDSLVKYQNFSDYKPLKLIFPVDTIGFFIAKRTSASTLILKYTPSMGFTIAYEDAASNFTSMGFTPDKTVFVTGAGSSGNIILRTDDLGITWYPLNTNLDTRLNSINFVDDLTGYAAGDEGKILKTENKGLTWIQQTCPYVSYNHIAFIDRDLGFAYAGRTIVKTTNGGGLWTPINARTSVPVISPNPNDGAFVIKLPETGDLQQKCLMTISDCRGSILVQHYVSANNGQLPFDLTGITPGVYFLGISTDTSILPTVKLVVK